MRGGGCCGAMELQRAKLRVLPRLPLLGLLGVHWACCARCGQVDLASLQPQLAAAAQLTGQERISPTLDEILRLLGEAPGPGAAAEAEDFVRRVAGGSLWSPWAGQFGSRGSGGPLQPLGVWRFGAAATLWPFPARLTRSTKRPPRPQPRPATCSRRPPAA